VAKHAYNPLPSLADYREREDCLYEEINRLIPERGDSVTELDDIAFLATGICSRLIWQKMVDHAAGLSGMQVMTDELNEEEIDQLKTKQHAFAIAMQIREKRRAASGGR
jgi:hypothetical protein